MSTIRSAPSVTMCPCSPFVATPSESLSVLTHTTLVPTTKRSEAKCGISWTFVRYAGASISFPKWRLWSIVFRRCRSAFDGEMIASFSTLNSLRKQSLKSSMLSSRSLITSLRQMKSSPLVKYGSPTMARSTLAFRFGEVDRIFSSSSTLRCGNNWIKSLIGCPGPIGFNWSLSPIYTMFTSHEVQPLKTFFMIAYMLNIVDTPASSTIISDGGCGAFFFSSGTVFCRLIFLTFSPVSSCLLVSSGSGQKHIIACGWDALAIVRNSEGLYPFDSAKHFWMFFNGWW